MGVWDCWGGAGSGVVMLLTPVGWLGWCSKHWLWHGCIGPGGTPALPGVDPFVSLVLGWGSGAVVAIYTTSRKLFQQVKTDMAVPVLRECQLGPEKKCEDEFLECQQGFWMSSQPHCRWRNRKSGVWLVEENIPFRVTVSTQIRLWIEWIGIL